MDIKEIALRLLAEEFPGMHQENQAFMVEFAEALIESYKAELLKEAGEPVLYAEFAEDGGWLGDASEYADHLEEPHALFTSYQLAAAIIKATKPLEEVKEALGEYICSADDSPAAVRRLVSAYQERNNSAAKYCSQLNEQDAELEQLRQQLATAQEEIESTRTYFTTLLEEQRVLLAKAEQLWQVAQGRCDGLEEKLAKAERLVSEACAAMCDHLQTIQQFGENGYGCEAAITRGEWRKFVKDGGMR